jgi:hypothetical protein
VAKMADFKTNIIVSDITYKKNLFCVAGWDKSANKMRRLLLDGKYWHLDDIKKLGQYAEICVEVLPDSKKRTYPHKNEDTIISSNFKVAHRFNEPKSLALALKKSVSANIADAFNNKLIGHEYVHAKTNCSSLGAILVDSKDINFYKNDNQKLRLRVKDSDKQIYDLRISCKYLRDILKSESDLETLNKEMQVFPHKAHIRLGLAKPFVHQKNKCYLMCNGLFLYR